MLESFEKFWEACSAENMGHIADLQDPFDYERMNYLPEVLEIMSATEEGRHCCQEDLPYLCWLWYKASSHTVLAEYDEFLKAVRAETGKYYPEAYRRSTQNRIQEELFSAIHKTGIGLHTFTAYGHWGEKMVLDLFVKIAALSIALWFVCVCGLKTRRTNE